MVRVADLVPNPHNPRRHSDKQRRALAKIIRRVGFTSAIVIDAGNAIICGELRVEAAKDVGIESVPAVRVGDLDEADIRALIIADNRIAELAEWDTKGLKAQFDYLVSIDYDVDLTGFEPPEIDIIIADGDSP
jgi:ParB-like chromosome segregation protein Spo0J